DPVLGRERRGPLRPRYAGRRAGVPAAPRVREGRDNKAVTDRDAARDLVLANRILAREEVLDAFGHVSVRDPADPSRFHIARSLSPAQVTAADLQTLDLGGTRVAGDERA